MSDRQPETVETRPAGGGSATGAGRALPGLGHSLSGPRASWALALSLSLLAAYAAGPEPRARHALVAPLAWLLAMAMGARAVRGSEGWKPELRWFSEPLGLLLLFALALELRLTGLEAIPQNLSGDESAAGLWALDFASGRVDNVLGWGWFSFPALHVALQSIPVALLGNTVAALRAGSAVVGSLGVLAVYGLGRALYGRATGLLAAVFTAVWHYPLAFSHIGLNNIYDPLLASLAWLGLWLGWQARRRAGFALLGLALGLGQYFYVGMRLMPLLILAWCLLLSLPAGERRAWRWRGLGASAGLALIVALPLLILALQQPAAYRAPFLRVSLAAEPLVAGYRDSWALLLLGRVARAVLGLFQEPLQSFYTPGAPMLLPGAASLAALGLLLLLLDRDRRGLLLALPVGMVLASASLSMEVPAAQRYILASPSLAILVALPLGRTLDGLAGRRSLWRGLAGAATLVLTLWLAGAELRLFFGQVPDRWQIGGDNTRTANHLARHLAAREVDRPTVYYHGSPRMGLPTEMRYLAPRARFHNVLEPLSGPPDRPLDGPTLFYFLPERVFDWDWVVDAYPEGEGAWVAPDGRTETGFWYYAVAPTATPPAGATP